MRLTLRTMLAYLDELLEPEDQQEIGCKIEESQYATDLVRRIRDVVRRLRLGAPTLAARATGLDPNTVAEYLDNTLAAERVAEFERVCLESDICLAEVAACHQILTLVQGQPADVNADTRQRMYNIPALAEQMEQQRWQDAAEPAPNDDTIVGAAAEPVSTAANVSQGLPGTNKADRAKPEIPDYLRTSRGVPLKRLAVLAGIGVAVLVWGVWFVLQSSQRDQSTGPVASSVVSEPVQRREPEQFFAPPSEVDPKSPAVEPLGNGHLPPGEPEASPEESSTALGETTPIAVQEPAEDDSPAAEAGATVLPGVDPVPEEVEREEPAESTEGLGICSTTQLLLRYDKAAREWRRLSLGTPIAAGDELIALPTFQPTVELSSGVTFSMTGGTRVTLQEIADDRVPRLEIRYGRVVIWNTGGQESRLDVQLGDQSQQIAFDATEAALALELRRELVPGLDPLESAGTLTVHLYATRGAWSWTSPPAAPVSVEAPSRWMLAEGRLVQIGQGNDLPTWTKEEQLNAIDRRAARDVDEELKTDRPVALTLDELVKGHRLGRRPEVRSLAARSLRHVGELEPLIAALNELNEKPPFRPLHVETLRDALALGPEDAAQVRSAFEQQRGKELGDELFHLLWGFTGENLSQGDAAKLVSYLEHEQLDVRLLALWNLVRLTGLGQLNRLEDPRADRQALRRWKKLLEDKRLVTKPQTP